MSGPEGRVLANRLGTWLVGKGRGAEALGVLCAWAANGPNDQEAHQLLAAAYRIDQRSELAKQVFEGMEGIAANRAELDAAVAKYTLEELKRLEAEMNKPTFRKAQVGFNNNLKHKEAVYHVQTEDSGLDKPHVITHLFADGGRIIKSYKRTYAAELGRPDVDVFVRSLMKAQHMEMVIALREGKYDLVVEGKASGGMEVIETPPDPDLVARANQKKGEKAAPKPPPPPKPSAAPQLSPTGPGAAKEAPKEAPIVFKLHVTRCLWDAPDFYESRSDYAEFGKNGLIKLEGEKYCHPREAAIVKRDGELWLQDFEGGNGVFVRIRRPVELAIGDEFIVGDQLLRIERNPQPDDEPDAAPTYCYSSPRRPSPFRVVQIYEGGALGACTVARGTTLQIGAAWCDLVLLGDPLVSDYHCLVDEQAGVILLTDLSSRTGVFVRVQGEQKLQHGDELLVGRTRLVVDAKPT